MSKHDRAYMREYMQKYRAAGRDKGASNNHVQLPFMAIDGEGGTDPVSGYHAYFLLRAGNSSLLPRKGAVRLTTRDCLEFLCSLPSKAILVGYFFDYDVTKILEDLPLEKLDRLMHRDKRMWPRSEDMEGMENKDIRPRVMPVTFGGYEIDYLPRKEFKVRREGSRQWTVINDVGSFFQCRFVEAIEKWEVSTPEIREAIGAGKDLRNDFSISALEEIAEYNGLEIECLQELMEKFRKACVASTYVPAKWQGPGLLAEAMYSKNGVPRTKDVPLLNNPVYADLMDFARNSFYGGRPELTGVGPVDCVVEQWDINSAYPAAMLSVPCLTHGTWEKKTYGLPASELNDNLRLVYGSFAPKPSTVRLPSLYGLPIRTSEGTITYPASGKGWYWGFEVLSSIHQNFIVDEAWEYSKECDCVPLSFVAGIYEQRLAAGKDSAGIPIKLGLNSLYGKTVQSIGKPKYANPIWGSFLTSWCRTQIQHFIHASPLCGTWCGSDVLMIATDSVCTTTIRTDIVESKELGGWSREIHSNGMFLVQPGLYFGSSGKPTKTRGVPRSVIEEKEAEFRSAFERLVSGKDLSLGDVRVPQRMFVGIKSAVHRRNMKLLGQWVEFVDEDGREGKVIKFDWSSKRAAFPVLNPTTGRSWLQTFPQDGDVNVESLPYSKNIGGLVLRDSLRAMYVEQPDWSSQIEPVNR